MPHLLQLLKRASFVVTRDFITAEWQFSAQSHKRAQFIESTACDYFEEASTSFLLQNCPFVAIRMGTFFRQKNTTTLICCFWSKEMKTCYLICRFIFIPILSFFLKKISTPVSIASFVCLHWLVVKDIDSQSSWFGDDGGPGSILAPIKLPSE